MARSAKDLAGIGDSSLAAESRWLAQVCHPDSALKLNLNGISGRLRLPPGWSVQSHTQEEHLWYFVGDGSFEAQIDRHPPGIISAGGFLWVGPGVPFRFHLPRDGSLAIVRLRLRIRRSGRTVDAPWPWHHAPNAATVAPWLEALVDEAGGQLPWAAARVRALVLGLSTELFRVAAEAAIEPSGRLTRAQQETLRDFISRRGAMRTRPADLARALDLSADYFTRRFRQTFGRSPRRWIVEQRVRLAAVRLIESNRQVSEVAEELGYPDVFSFSRQFKEVTGESPRAYREKRGRMLALG